jgi:hypothetical protein
MRYTLRLLTLDQLARRRVGLCAGARAVTEQRALRLHLGAAVGW